MRKNALFPFLFLLCCSSCYTRYLRIGLPKGQWPPCADATTIVVHKIGQDHKTFIKNYIKTPLCDSLANRGDLLELIDLKDVVPTVSHLKDVLGEPLHIYTNKDGYKAFFYPSFGRQNKQGFCEIDQLFIIFYQQNDSLWLDYNALFYDAFTKNCNGDNMPSFLKYWNSLNLPKESKYGDKFAPIDFTYDKQSGGCGFTPLEHKTYPNESEKKE